MCVSVCSPVPLSLCAHPLSLPASAWLWPSPVHEIHEHLGVLLVLLHLHSVCQDHVQVEHEVLNLQDGDAQGQQGQRGQGWMGGEGLGRRLSGQSASCASLMT